MNISFGAVPMAVYDANILILCKTYPSPSGKYVETTCVAGMNEDGQLIRLFPVPFRLIAQEQKFKKWQWISVKVEKATRDHRPESHSIKVDTIKLGAAVDTSNRWRERRRLLSRLHLFTSFDEIKHANVSKKTSLALVKPARVLRLVIEKVGSPSWTDDELSKLLQAQNQGGLFDDQDKPDIRTLEKLPYDFYYEYECHIGDKVCVFKHKLVDWEVGALFFNCRDSHKEHWEKPFREKLEKEFPTRDLMFLMGNMHRFKDQWLIISLIYPPHELQQELF